jgi:hypothetical protein
VPSVAIAALLPAPAATWANPAPTRVSRYRLANVPSPSWPRSFAPQVQSVPSAFRAAVWRYVAEIWAKPPSPTTTGRVRRTSVPSHSWPAWFEPHTSSVPSERSTTVCPTPAATSTTPSGSTWAGVGRGVKVMVPSPSWPDAFEPQIHNDPSVFTAAA